MGGSFCCKSTIHNILIGRSRVQQQRRAAAAAMVETDIFAASAHKRKFEDVPEVSEKEKAID